MGGPGSGGRRSGAGAKKKPSHLRGIDGGAGRRGGAPGAVLPPPPPSELPPVSPPADLAPDERQVWDAWAPMAHQERTLTTSTLPAFELLCQLEVDRRSIRRRFWTAAGPTFALFSGPLTIGEGPLH